MSKKNPSWADDPELLEYALTLDAAGLSRAETARLVGQRAHRTISKSALCGAFKRRGLGSRPSPIGRYKDGTVSASVGPPGAPGVPRVKAADKPPKAPTRLRRDEWRRKHTLDALIAEATLPALPEPPPPSVSVEEMMAIIAEAAADVQLLAEQAMQTQEPPRRSPHLEPWHMQCRYVAGDRPYVQCERERVPTLGRGSYCAEHHRLCAVDRRLREVEE